jgi:uncharacterized membrane protein YfcA
VALAFAAEATTGFGATVIALTLGVHLFPLGVLLPVLVPFGLVLSAAITWRGRRHVDRQALLRRILPLMGVGLALGLSLFERASSESLRRAFGVFVVAIASHQLLLLRGSERASAPLPPLAERLALLGAGVVHGLFASGGPLLVYALGRSPLEKRAFRATLSSVWLVLGVALTAAYAAGGRLGRDSLLATATLLPVLAFAIPAGEWAHHRLDEQRFRLLVFSLLLAAGLTNVF